MPAPQHSSLKHAKRAAMFAACLHRQWQRRGLLATFLWPLAALHQGIWQLKQIAYRRGWRSSIKAPVPVVIVGNIIVGGAGKTPLIIALVEALRARGWTPGVISRGYGSQQPITMPRVGKAPLDPTLFGDEPSLIAQQTAAPIAIHPRRADAAHALCQAHPEIDLILADDGLQHLALARDIEILVEDARGIGNGWMLPAGPLREPPQRRQQVDALISNLALKAPPSIPPPIGVRSTAMRLLPSVAIRLHDGYQLPLAALPSSTTIAAVAGIGQPQRFFDMLEAAGVRVSEFRALPDHADFSGDPFEGLTAEMILITDKDAVKCRDHHDSRLWRVPVTATLDDPSFFDWLHQKLLAQSTASHS